MNLENLLNEEFCDLIRRVEKLYKNRIPRDVKAALFIRIVSDPQRDAFRLEKRLERGRSSLQERLASKDRELHRKLFHE